MHDSLRQTLYVLALFCQIEATQASAHISVLQMSLQVFTNVQLKRLMHAHVVTLTAV